MSRILLLLLFTFSLYCSYASDFNEVFSDSTLRIDYILSGTQKQPAVSIHKKYKSPHWYGRKSNLLRPKYLGNDCITVTSLNGDTIYSTSFSSLYNEWLSLGDSVAQAFEATVLIPLPKDTAIATLQVFDSRHNTIASHALTIYPNDILTQTPVKPTTPYKYIHKGNYPGHKISVAILAEGYTLDEMDTFLQDANTTVEALFDHEPFNEMRERFDFIAVLSPSADSGVSIPKFNDWKNTAFSSNFSTFYSDRYLTTNAMFDVNDALTGIPYEHIIILANTEEYGGGGIFNSMTLTAAHHPKFRPVVVHEFGHSFGGLADEYFYVGDVMDDTYPTDVEPWEPNVTSLVDFASKWQHLIPEGTPTPTDPKDADKYPIGLYEGAAYSFKGLYRPADFCRMRTNDIDHFCPVCQNALRDLIIYYTE